MRRKGGVEDEEKEEVEKKGEKKRRKRRQMRRKGVEGVKAKRRWTKDRREGYMFGE